MNNTLKTASLFLIVAAASLPAAASAQTYRQHRDAKKNEWKNIGIGAAAVGVYGLIKGDRTLTIAGLAGAAYSGYRYSQDGKNDRRYDRYGYDQYGYNRSGYDRYGYNRTGVNRYGQRRDTYDRYGRTQQYDRYGRAQQYDRYDRNDRYDRYDRDDKWNGRGPGNSDFGHSRGLKRGHDKH